MLEINYNLKKQHIILNFYVVRFFFSQQTLSYDPEFLRVWSAKQVILGPHHPP